MVAGLEPSGEDEDEIVGIPLREQVLHPIRLRSELGV
jgi:hypothetical protein